MTCSIKIFHFFVFIFLSVSLFANTNCDSVRYFYKRKIDSIYNSNINTLNKYPLANEYFSIIKPELAVFDLYTDNIQKNLIKFLFLININNYNKISVGPFQMQLKFIETVLLKSKTYSYLNVNFNNSISKFLVDNLDLITSFEFQCFILQKYIQLYRYNKLNKVNSIDFLTFNYNTGRFPSDSTNFHAYTFKKITTCKMSYVQWSHVL